jgi:hypothetical protein
MSSRRFSAGLLSATAFSLLLSFPAAAEVDAKAVVDAVIAQMDRQNFKLTVGSATLDGANVVAKDISIGLAGGEPMKIAEITLENVTEKDGGGYLIGSLAAPATTIDKEGMKVEFGGASLNGYTIPAVGETDPVKLLGLYQSMNVAPMRVSSKGAEVFRMDGITATMSEYVKDQPLTFEAALKGLWGDLSKIEDRKAQETLAAFGYKEITGGITMKGSWNPSDGKMSVTEALYNIDNVGKLNVLFDISGYTPELVKGIQEMSKSMEGQDESAKGLAMLGLLQQLNFISMTIRFDDASITGKALDYAAKQAGQDRAAIINQTKGVLPFALAQLKDPDFAQKVTEAASEYLDNPKSLEIKAAPPAPVPFAILAATGSTTPEALIKQLNVTVTANQ